MSSIQQFYGTGRRKTASARVFVRVSENSNAKNNVTVNHLALENYLPGEVAHITVFQPLALLKLNHGLDIYVTVRGGGKSAQRDAIRHGLTKAIIAWEKAGLPAHILTEKQHDSEEEPISFHKQLRKAGLVTRDARQVERKKPGLHKARKRAQYSKR